LPSSKKKIGLFLDFTRTGGGIFQYDLTLLNAIASLPQDHYDRIVFYVGANWEPHIHKKGLRALELRFSFLGKAVGKLWRLAHLPMATWRMLSPMFYGAFRTLRYEKCDLVIYPSQDRWSYQIETPALVSIHDLMHRYERRFPEVSANGQYDQREFQYWNICRIAKGILVDSQLGAQHVQEAYSVDPSKLHVLPYIAPEYMFSQTAFDSSQRYFLPAKFIFYPAQFWDHKNHVHLLQAIADLKTEIPDIRLVLAGSKAHQFEAVQKRVRDLRLQDQVVFLGYVPDEDMPALYKKARALVMPTFFGPTNIPPLEAFVAGCPVAISDIYGMREQLGDAAIYFNPELPSSIGLAIRQLWTNDILCSQLVELGRKHSEQWNQELFNRQLERILQKVLPS
jgi:glycosyltransferase involved in cell wall biosynthesis